MLTFEERLRRELEARAYGGARPNMTDDDLVRHAIVMDRLGLIWDLLNFPGSSEYLAEQEALRHELTPEPTGKRKCKPVQTSLFAESAVDDWGDSAELRRTNAGMKRLL